MSASPKEKKITVKFFLNQALEPVTGERGKKLYPLYLQLTYNRKNMQLKSRYGLFYKNLKEVPAELTTFEEKLLTKIIRYEAKGDEERYELKGLKRKYDVYSLSVYQALEAYLKPKLRLAVLKRGGELAQVLDFSQPRISTGLLHQAAALMFPNFDSTMPQKLRDELETYKHFQTLNKEPVLSYDFPTIIDWVEGSHKTELVKLVQASKTLSPLTLKRITTLIHEAADERLKALSDTK